MNPKVEKVFMVIWQLGLLLVLGAVFNTAIAFASLWFQEISMVTATLTGYGIFSLFNRSKT